MFEPRLLYKVSFFDANDEELSNLVVNGDVLGEINESFQSGSRAKMKATDLSSGVKKQVDIPLKNAESMSWALKG